MEAALSLLPNLRAKYCCLGIPSLGISGFNWNARQLIFISNSSRVSSARFKRDRPI